MRFVAGFEACSLAQWMATAETHYSRITSHLGAIANGMTASGFVWNNGRLVENDSDELIRVCICIFYHCNNRSTPSSGQQPGAGQSQPGLILDAWSPHVGHVQTRIESQALDSLVVVLCMRIVNPYHVAIAILSCAIRCCWIECTESTQQIPPGTGRNAAITLLSMISCLPQSMYTACGHELEKQNQAMTRLIAQAYYAGRQQQPVPVYVFETHVFQVVCVISTCMQRSTKFAFAPDAAGMAFVRVATFHDLLTSMAEITADLFSDPRYKW